MTGFGRVDIIDCGVNSVGVRHETAVEKGMQTWLEFTWSGRLIRLDCEVRSSKVPRGEDRYRTGLMIRGGASAEEYRRRVTEALTSQSSDSAR